MNTVSTYFMSFLKTMSLSASDSAKIEMGCTVFRRFETSKTQLLLHMTEKLHKHFIPLSKQFVFNALIFRTHSPHTILTKKPCLWSKIQVNFIHN